MRSTRPGVIRAALGSESAAFAPSEKRKPGVFEMGGEPVALNPKSVFEEVKVTPDADGEYDFYLDVTGEAPVTYVKKH